jgi:hypothetical protein
MTIESLLKDDDSFDLEEVILLTDAFENAVSDMAIDREAPTALVAATRIVELARKGERDPNRLCDEAVNAIQARQDSRSSATTWAWWRKSRTAP